MRQIILLAALSLFALLLPAVSRAADPADDPAWRVDPLGVPLDPDDASPLFITPRYVVDAGRVFAQPIDEFVRVWKLCSKQLPDVGFGGWVS